MKTVTYKSSNLKSTSEESFWIISKWRLFLLSLVCKKRVKSTKDCAMYYYSFMGRNYLREAVFISPPDLPKIPCEVVIGERKKVRGEKVYKSNAIKNLGK